jgi:hypothetical protein
VVFASSVAAREVFLASVFVRAASGLEVFASSVFAQEASGLGASGRTEQARARLASSFPASVAAWALVSVAGSATWQCRPCSSAAAATSCSEEVNACYGWTSCPPPLPFHERQSPDAASSARPLRAVPTRASGDGRCAGRKQRVTARGQSDFKRWIGSLTAEQSRHWQARRCGRDHRAGEMDERAHRAIAVGEGRGFIACGKGSTVRAGRCMNIRQRRRMSRPCTVEMNMGKRHGELEGERKQRQPRTQSRTRPEPVHRRYASCALTQAAEPCRPRTLVTM